MLTATTTHTHADGHNHHLRLSLTLVFSLFNRTARQCFPSLSQSDDRGLLRMNSGIDVSLSFSPLHSPSSSSSSSSLSPSSLVVNSTSNGTFLHRQRSTSPTDSSSAQLQVDFARSVSGEDSKIFPVATSSIVISSSDSDVAATDRIQERHLEDVAVTDNYHSSHKLAHRHSVLETPPLSSSLADRRMPTGNGHRLRWQSSSGRVEESSCSLEFEEEEEGLGDHFCKIKNLDNGKEFIVNECRKDSN